MKPARIISLVIGSLLVLVGFGLLAGGGVLFWALGTQRDDAGYFTTSTQRFTTDSHALTSDKIDLGDPGPNAFGDWANASVRIRVGNSGTGETFVGIAPEADIETYLAGVAHDDITTTERFGGSTDVTYRRENPDGSVTPSPPATQTFWVAQTVGAGTHDIVWQVEGGSWAIVVMNADGTANVAADVQVGASVDHLPAIATGLSLGGLVILAGGGALIIAGAARRNGGDLATLPPPTNDAPPLPLATAAADTATSTS